MNKSPNNAPGGAQLSSPLVIPTSPADAKQGVKNKPEPTGVTAVQSAGVQISRRSIMNMLVSTAAIAAAPALASDHSKRVIGLTASQKLRDTETLADLMDNLAITKAAAENACTVLSNTEEKYRGADGKLARAQKPKVYGGPTHPISIIADGVSTEIKPGEWFFRNRNHVKQEGTREQLAEWDRQAIAARRAYPKELRAAEREQERAMDSWTAAERALTAYKPTSAAEATELLTLAGKPHERGTLYLDIDQWAFHDLVANCAAALREAFTN